MPNTAKDKNQQSSSNTSKGFASMPHEKVQEIAHKGGQASADKAGHAGMSERGRKGGEARAEQLGHKGDSAAHEHRGRQSSTNEEGVEDKQQPKRTTDSGHAQGFASQQKEKEQGSGRKEGTHSR